MKVAILAGGFGTRISEETDIKPKPMVEIGGRPILWHIMKYFSCFGMDDFYVATGYKGDVIKSYFLNYRQLNGSFAIDLSSGDVYDYTAPPEAWKVNLIETGQGTMTGGRIKKMERWLTGSGSFITTYGDGLADVDLRALLEFHQSHGKIATITAVRPPARFGTIDFDGNRISAFAEKHQTGEGWINGGFIVFNQEVFDYIEKDDESLESVALEKLAEQNELMAYKHEGFWQCMDTLRDKIHLESLWNENKAPWKIWSDQHSLKIVRAA